MPVVGWIARKEKEIVMWWISIGKSMHHVLSVLSKLIE
jgi:hypothetical protein